MCYDKDRSDHPCIIYLIYHYWNDCAICTYEDGKQRKKLSYLLSISEKEIAVTIFFQSF